MTNQAINIQHLSVTFNGAKTFEALKDVSFSIEAGKTLALIGTSGSGKSVTSLAIMGLLPKTASVKGSITLSNETNILKNSENEWQKIRGNQVAMIFQEPMSALNPLLTVGDQLIESIKAHQNLSFKAVKKLAIEWFEKVKLPKPELLLDRYPHQVSGGQKQRVMIAMAMCNHPKLLIADEPTTALDVTVQQEIVELMKQLQEEFKTAILFITHDLRLANKIADDFIVMEHGHLIQEKLKPINWQQKDKYKGSNNAILSVKNVSVFFPEKKTWLGKTITNLKAVDDVSFEIKKGETLGLVGESGCGKSTLSKAILGLQEITSGQIFFNQIDLTKLSTKGWQSIRSDIQIIFQDPYSSLNPRIKIGDAISEVVQHYKRNKTFDAHNLKSMVETLLEKVQLPPSFYDKYPHELSGGQRQRISIARALAMNPQLIICDESVAALDVNTQEQILLLLKELQQKENLTYLFITHDLKVVEAISDRIIVMQAGKLVEQGDTIQIIHQPQQEYMKRLIAAAL